MDVFKTTKQYKHVIKFPFLHISRHSRNMNYSWLFTYDKICVPFHKSKNQTHGSQPTQTLPSTFGSMAWSSRQSTCFSTDNPAAGSLARMLCSSDPRATACIPGKAASFSKPSFSSSLTKTNQQLITHKNNSNAFQRFIASKRPQKSI